MNLRISANLETVGEPPVARAQRWIQGRSFGSEQPLLDLSQAVPGYPPARELQDHLRELVGLDATSRYASSLGLIETRDAIDRHMTTAFAMPSAIGIDRVMVTAGCNQAFCLAIGALCAPGDEVLVPTPFYFNHDMWLRANGISTVEVVVDAANGMLPSIEALERACTPRTRAVVFVTPNNPCGIEYPRSLIEAGYAFAKDRGLAFILDETYKDFRSSDEPSHTLFDHTDWDTTLVHLFSFSKVFSIPGYRVGSLIAAPRVLAAAMKLADCQTIGAPRISQLAVAFGLDHLDDWVAERRGEMQTRVDAFTTALTTRPGGYELVSAGAFFAYVRHPFGDADALDIAPRLADEQNLLTIPGPCFGSGQSQYLRVAFGNIDAVAIPEVIDRLKASRR